MQLCTARAKVIKISSVVYTTNLLQNRHDEEIYIDMKKGSGNCEASITRHQIQANSV